jgi:hypothetical protein
MELYTVLARAVDAHNGDVEDQNLALVGLYTRPASYIRTVPVSL